MLVRKVVRLGYMGVGYEQQVKVYKVGSPGGGDVYVVRLSVVTATAQIGHPPLFVGSCLVLTFDHHPFA
jgi:hypothetical protein